MVIGIGFVFPALCEGVFRLQGFRAVLVWFRVEFPRRLRAQTRFPLC